AGRGPAGIALGGAGGLDGGGALAPGALLILAPRFALRGRRRTSRDRGRRPGAEADVLALALEPAVRHLLASVVIERRGMERVADPLDDRWAELIAVRGEQTPRGRDQLVHGLALAIDGRA